MPGEKFTVGRKCWAGNAPGRASGGKPTLMSEIDYVSDRLSRSVALELHRPARVGLIGQAIHHCVRVYA